jgi:UDP-2,3-diacylglucosamine hydrolase
MDTDYMRFRAQVRSAAWQLEFMGQPLAQRQKVARALRTQSETRKRSGVVYSDVDSNETCNWLRKAQAGTLIHGHTHKPSDHVLENGLRRVVLSDWDAAVKPPRTEILRLSLNGVSSRNSEGRTIQRIATAMA